MKLEWTLVSSVIFFVQVSFLIEQSDAAVRRFFLDTLGSVYEGYCQTCVKCICHPDLHQECDLLKIDPEFQSHCARACHNDYKHCVNGTSASNTAATTRTTMKTTRQTTKVNTATTPVIQRTTTCNEFQVLDLLARHAYANDSQGDPCPNGEHHTAQSLVVKACGAPSPNRWTNKIQVRASCSSIPIYSPVGTFDPKDGSSQHAGILLSCLQNGFKMAAQSCDSRTEVVTVTDQSTEYDVFDFYSIQWRIN